MLSKTEIDQKFSAVKEHGEEVAAKFKEFVSALDALIPDGMEKNSILAHLRRASDQSHSALDRVEQVAKNALHQRAKSGEKPTTAPQDAPPPTVVPTQEPSVKNDASGVKPVS